MGDVALTTPAIRGLMNQYPEVRITLVTRSSFSPLFSSMYGLNLFFPDFRKKHKGLSGMIQLFRDLKKTRRIDHVLDLHDVLRSKMLRWLFRLSGVPVHVIDKGRIAKKQVINGKRRIRLKHSVERYCDVLASAGFPVVPEKGPWIIPATDALEKVCGMVGASGTFNVGVAPYANHELKTWPVNYMVRLLALIAEKRRVTFWLFGGREEIEPLTSFQKQVPGSFLVAGNLSLGEELALISRLDFMIAMDSSNMHMAALTGTKVISIWGSTDPLTGFGAWQQPDDFAIGIPAGELPCRPCSVFGKGTCRRGDLACLNRLTTEKVFERLVNLKMI